MTSDAADLAKATIQQIDLRPHSAERAKHKFKMIGIAERSAAGIPFNAALANREIIDAAEWCERQAA